MHGVDLLSSRFHLCKVILANCFYAYIFQVICPVILPGYRSSGLAAILRNTAARRAQNNDLFTHQIVSMKRVEYCV